MKQTILNTEEYEVLQLILNRLALQRRTGELGIIHGANRFVGTAICIRKPAVEALHKLCAKFDVRLTKVD